MSDDPTRKLMVELRRSLLTALKAIDEYLVATAKRPEEARKRYGPGGDRGYIAPLDK